MKPIRLVKIYSLCLFTFFSAAAFAERADRDQPTYVEADRISVDDLKKIQTLEGHVVLKRGTMRMLADKIVVTQDEQGFQTGVATGSPGDPQGLAKYREKREGRDDYIDGEALRIEYDGRTSKAELFGRAWVRSAGDEARGEYVLYDGETDKYLATGAPAKDAPPGLPKTAQGAPRARATIQPRNTVSNTGAKTGSKAGTKKTDPVPALKLKPSTLAQ